MKTPIPSSFLLFMSVLVFVFASGCSSAPKKEALTAPSNFKDHLIKAKTLSDKKPDESILLLNQILKSHKENNLSDDALYLMGTLLEKKGENQAAIKAFRRILSSKYSSPLDGRVIFRLYKLYTDLGDERKALQTLDFVEKNDLIDEDSLLAIEKLRAPLLLGQGRYLSYLKSSANQIKESEDFAFKKELFNKSLSILKIKITGPENKRVLSHKSLSVFHPQAALNLAEYYFEKGHSQRALSVLNKHASLFDSPYYQNQKIDLVQRAKTFEAADARTIGVLIPLSGRYQDVGEKILEGLQFSLRMWSLQHKTPIKLVILDTEAKPEQLDLAFDDMIKKDRPIAFVGGLVGKTAETLIKKSEDFKAPSIILSQKEGLVKNSKYSFQSSQPMSEYTDYMAELAIDTLNLKTASILHSKKGFSTIYAQTFAKSFEKRGGRIVSTLSHDKDERGSLPLAIKTLAQLHTIEHRKEEYQEALTAWLSSDKKRRTQNTPPIEELLPPRVEAELLFVADGPKNGGLIASTLAYFDIEDLPLFGPHLWNNPSFIKRGQRFIEGAIFAHSYFESEVLNSQCNAYYKQMYTQPLDIYSYKGLEAGTVLNSILTRFNIKSRSDMVYALSKSQNIKDFCFPKGLVRMDHNYFSPITPLTVQNRKITLFDPATYTKVSKKDKEKPKEQGKNPRL